jgi:hypothetical protein
MQIGGAAQAADTARHPCGTTRFGRHAKAHASRAARSAHGRTPSAFPEETHESVCGLVVLHDAVVRNPLDFVDPGSPIASHSTRAPRGGSDTKTREFAENHADPACTSGYDARTQRALEKQHGAVRRPRRACKRLSRRMRGSSSDDPSSDHHCPTGHGPHAPRNAEMSAAFTWPSPVRSYADLRLPHAPSSAARSCESTW